jgi:hypothetical protein
MGTGRYPKPDGERLGHSPSPVFGWTILPPARTEPAPDLPEPPPWLAELKGWPVSTRAEWKRLWETPQATQWDQTGLTLHSWALMKAKGDLLGPNASMLGELRQIEDRHGLSPKALLQLRWKVGGNPAAEQAETAKSTRTAKPRPRSNRKDRLLKIVEGDGN